MIEYDKNRTRQAVQFLVDSPYFHHHVVKLRSALRRPRALPFKGEAEVLNELVLIGRQNNEALENLVEVAEVKRSDRNDYQREYMAAKRKRERLVVELESALSGKPLTLDDRAKVIAAQYKIWNKEKDQHLAAHADLPWVERNRVTREFWELKERELVQLIEEARQRGPVHKHPKRVVHVPPQPKTPFGKQLAAAVGRESH